MCVCFCFNKVAYLLAYTDDKRSDQVHNGSPRPQTYKFVSDVEKITTRRREGVGVVVENNEESRRTFNKNSCDLLTAITHTKILVALYKTNKQFNKKTKLWKQNGRCLDE